MPKVYRVIYEEVGGWRSHVGDVAARSVADVLDIIEAKVLPTDSRKNVGGDVWAVNGEQYIASSDAHETDNFGFIDFTPMHADDDDDAEMEEATYTWVVTKV
jgi:hypothetical protein